MVGSRAEKDHRRRVGKNWVMIGFWRTEQRHGACQETPPAVWGGYSCTLTFRYSTGLVTLNLSMVEIMMAGVVRKKRRMKRTMLMIKQRIHQENPPTDRCSLWENGDVTIIQHWAKLRPQLAGNLILQLRDEYLVLKALQRRAKSPHWVKQMD